mmetsp:Transcript_9428/g.26910  ORF Transcript_9428/g.26910 Transcript_9428/m.26910 type:complete len:92 (+) Transcript_9428:279-554(+)
MVLTGEQARAYSPTAEAAAQAAPRSMVLDVCLRGKGSAAEERLVIGARDRDDNAATWMMESCRGAIIVGKWPVVMLWAAIWSVAGVPVPLD